MNEGPCFRSLSAIRSTSTRSRRANSLTRRLAALMLAPLLVATLPAAAHDLVDDTHRTAVVSAFAPELSALREDVEDAVVRSVNGVEFVSGRLEGKDVLLFLSGISMVNAAMTVQLALDRFAVERIVFSGIAGGVDPDLRMGDVVVPDRWGQHLEVVFARESEDGWSTPPFFEYPFDNFGMIFPRSTRVLRTGSGTPETRFWFPVDEALLALARAASTDLQLDHCTPEQVCLGREPRIVIGGPGVSGSAFVDNALFRTYAFETFGARVLDMESAAAAHVAWANGVPFIAVRSVSDLAGGSEHGNQLEVFFRLAAGNSATVLRAILRAMPE